ncbi:MDR family MFS transporter [Paramicrobacterium fandaimingii]|uniref:MDR family MFS transporter n=1 Tax=Paramicrobacterium fandaimingii TaxID=2708079 RepID=UPI00142244E8|nr:MDR family MFS transporter [Microbacterium fandaimingii]
MTDTLPTTTSPTQSTGKLLTALIVGGITAIFDTTIVAIGLHTLTERLDAPISTIQWVSTGYLLALAVAIPFVSWAQEKFGGKRLWLFALGLFVLGSILCACAWNAESLIAFRVVQGLGGGIMFPLMQTLAMQNVAPTAMARTMAVVGLPIALGPILGPVLGGIVLHWLDWQWLFLINVPLGVAGLVLAAIVINADHPHRGTTSQRLDFAGAALLVPALAGLLYGLSNVHAEGGFSRIDVFLPCVAGVVLLVAFVGWAIRRAGTALIDVRLLAQRSVRASSITLSFLGATLFASTFLLPLYFQSLRGADVLTAAVLLIPQGVGTFLARLIAGKLVDALGARLVAVVGFLIIAAATIPFALADANASVWLLGITLFIRGFGLGVVLIPVMTVAYIDIRKDQMPHASAITRIVQQLGGAFGTALVAVVLSAVTAQADAQSGFQTTFWWTIAITIAAAIASLLLPSREKNQ